MTNKTVKEIVKMVFNIYSLEFDVSNHDYYDKLRELTYSIWETNHSELLAELNELDKESNIDFQLFWYDCLGFPNETPHVYYKNGLPAFVFYGYIQSKLEDVISKFGGFHDMNINYTAYENNILTLFLDSRYCKTISNTEYEIKITFTDVEKIIYYGIDKKVDEELNIEKLMGTQILSFEEIPMIKYIFNSLKLDKTYFHPSKRLFWVISEYAEFYFICDKWTYEIRE